MKFLRSLRLLLLPGDRLKLSILALMAVAASFIEIVGLGLLFPYIAILQDQQRASESRILRAISQISGIESFQSIFLMMSAVLLVAFIGKGIFSLWTINYQLRFIADKQTRLGQRLLASYLSKPYEFFLTENTSTLIGTATSSLAHVCTGVFQSGLVLVAETMVLLGLLAFLIYLSPGATLAAMAIVTVFAIVFIKAIKSRVRYYAVEHDVQWKRIIRAVNEALSAVKELQILGRTQFFVDAYGDASRALGFSDRRYAILVQIPRYLLETFAVAGIVVFAASLLISGQVDKDLLATLAVFVVAAVRIMPATNRIVQAWNHVALGMPAVDAVVAGLVGASKYTPQSAAPAAAFPLKREVAVSVQSFRYPTDAPFHLHDIDLTIPQGRTVAFIGHTGSGKTTLVDLIIGLFPDFDGSIRVDGCDIRGNIPGWRHSIGYIPQAIYLRDDTVARNVAFGVPAGEVNVAQVERCLEVAGLGTIIQSLPDGLNALVGDRGIRLSGGERQRLGIARALYHDPGLLVLDEATSALDYETEYQIVESILGLSPAKTTIVIAHRLNTVKRCDEVVLMQSGTVIDRGPYDDIAARHPDFVKVR